MRRRRERPHLTAVGVVESPAVCPMDTEVESRTPAWKLAAMMLAGFAFALLGIELVLRVAWSNPYANERDHVLTLHKLSPNIDRTYDRSAIDPHAGSVTLRTDARSYIRPSFQYADPDVTIVFMGGSTTACVAVRQELRFPALVSALLAEHGIEANTFNAARPGGNLHDSLNVFLNHVVLDRPDVAVLMHAVNDHGTLAKVGDYTRSMGEPLSPRLARHWLKQGISSHSALAGLLRERLAGFDFRPRELPAGVVERNDPDAAQRLSVQLFRERLRAFAALTRAFGVVPVFMTQPLSDTVTELTPDWADLSAQEIFNAEIRRVAQEEGVQLIDLVQYLNEEVPGWKEPMRVFYDGMHVTDEGSRAYAKRISEALLPLARERVSRAGS